MFVARGGVVVVVMQGLVVLVCDTIHVRGSISVIV